MKVLEKLSRKFQIARWLIALGAMASLLLLIEPTVLMGQAVFPTPPPDGSPAANVRPAPDVSAGANATPPPNAAAIVRAQGAAATNAAAPVVTPPPGAVALPPGVVAPPPGAELFGQPNPGGMTQPDSPPPAPTDEIQLSFQGANIEMVVQWLARTTGKSVVKHPRVQCQLTIVSSKKLMARDAITLVYRALALEGFTTVESSKSIMIVPDGQEPKMSPELVDASRTDIPDGRQKLIKIFPLKHGQAGELRDKIRAVLTDKATIEVSERANQLIVTDYSDNIRLLSDLMKELDVPAGGDTVIEFYSLKYSEAEELATLLTLVLNAQSPPPSSPSSSSRSSSSRSSPFPEGMPPGVVMPTPSPSPGSSSSSPGAGASGGQQVKIWPDKTSNRLIVAAPKAKFPEIEKLINLLDAEKPQDVSIRVIPLKNVSAEDLVREIGPLYQKLSGKSLKDVVEVTFNNRSNSLIILSSENNFKAIERLIKSLDTEDAQEKSMETFPLKNADAEDVAKQLQDLQQDQDSQSRYPFFIYSSSSSNRGPSKKVNVVADRRRNSVIVQAPPAALENIRKLISALDAPVTDDALAPRIFRLKYVSATDIEDVLNELFLKKQQQQRTYWDPYGPTTSTSADNTGGRLYGKVRITSEPYSNSLIVTSNSPENLAAVEEVLKQLDVPSEAGETTLRVGLKFAKAVTVATSLNVLFAKGGSPPLRANAQQPQSQEARNPQQPQQPVPSQTNFELEQEVKEDSYYPWLGGQQESLRTPDGRQIRPVSDLVGRVRVVPDKRINSVLITCNMHFFPQVLKLVNELDAPTAQVLIEAKIIEVSSDFRDKLGVRWSPDGTQTFDASDLDNALQIKTGAAYKQVFTGSALADSLRTGVLNSSINLDFLIQFLRKNTDSAVLAEPQINIADNELGRLFVGSQVPFLSGSFNTGLGGRNDTYMYRDVGIILEVTPHINDSEEVALRIRAESSNIRNGETLFGGAILDTRNFRTDVLVKSGQTVVLGGIIQRENSDTLRKVPGLGNVPGLGWAFKKKDKVIREVELMVFLRPWVTRTPAEVRDLREKVESKVPMIKKWQNDLEQKALEEKNK